MIPIVESEKLLKHFITERFAVSIVIRHSLTLHIADRWKIRRFLFGKKLLQNLKMYQGNIKFNIWV